GGVALGGEHHLAVVLEARPELAGLVLGDLELVRHVDLRLGAAPPLSEPEPWPRGQAGSHLQHWQAFAALAYMLTAMSFARLFAALGLAALATACAPTLGPPPPGPMSSGPVAFSAQDFAWSKAAGGNTVAGMVAYREGPVRFTCAGSSV